MAGDNNIFYQGESRQIEFTYCDVNNQPVDLTTFSQVLVQLRTTRDEGVVEQWSRETRSGYNDAQFEQLDQVTDTGRFNVYLDVSDTQKQPPGRLYFEIKMGTTNTNFEGNIQWTTWVVEVDDNGNNFELVKSKINGEV